MCLPLHRYIDRSKYAQNGICFIHSFFCQLHDVYVFQLCNKKIFCITTDEYIHCTVIIYSANIGSHYWVLLKVMTHFDHFWTCALFRQHKWYIHYYLILETSNYLPWFCLSSSLFNINPQFLIAVSYSLYAGYSRLFNLAMMENWREYLIFGPKFSSSLVQIKLIYSYQNGSKWGWLRLLFYLIYFKHVWERIEMRLGHCKYSFALVL